MVAAAPLATRVSMRNMEVVDDVCRSALGCGGADLATIALVAVAVVLALVVFAVAVHVREATSLLTEECERLRAERDAFEAFTRRVATLETSEASAAVPATGGITTTATALPDDGLEEVREAYRETVMAVPHYEADYGEPLVDSVAAEFGEDVAVAVVDGGRLTPQLKSALLEGSREAQRSRTALRSSLEAEAESLERSAAELAEVDAEREAIADRAPLPERSFEALEADWRRLGELADRCRGVVAERQATLRDRSPTTPPTVPDLQAYLYDDLSVDYPVLADASALVEAVESARSRLLRSLTRRV